MSEQVRRAENRFRTDADGRTTWHSFSFGEHYDPDDVGFGLLVAHNDEILPPGTGYSDHPHRDLEIVSVVLSGALRHTSDVGSAVLGPGAVQRLSAGRGVRHAEVADSDLVPTRFLQTWIRPAEPGGEPSYAHRQAPPAPGWVPLVGGDAELDLAAPARLWRATLVGVPLELPAAPRLHVFCVSGRVRVAEHALQEADALRLVDQGGTVTGTGEVLVWALA